eukprot:6210737-Pleurochrysis_carterae.AAC.5
MHTRTKKQCCQSAEEGTSTDNVSCDTDGVHTKENSPTAQRYKRSDTRSNQGGLLTRGTALFLLDVLGEETGAEEREQDQAKEENERGQHARTCKVVCRIRPRLHEARGGHRE